MGKSDKPDIAYMYQDHKRYVDGFIENSDYEILRLSSATGVPCRVSTIQCITKTVYAE